MSNIMIELKDEALEVITGGGRHAGSYVSQWNLSTLIVKNFSADTKNGAGGFSISLTQINAN